MILHLVIYWILVISKKKKKIDLSKQTKLKDPQQINFIGKLEKNNGATTKSKNQKKQPLIFHKILPQSYK